MKTTIHHHPAAPLLLATILAAVSGSGHAAAPITATGYQESFDSMGTSGTAAPAHWSVWTGATGTSNTTWTSTIPGSGVAAMVAASGVLTATSAPTATNNNGYNAALSPASLNDRVLATSPTTTAGGALQVDLLNSTGTALEGVTVSFDTVRYTSVATANELPGYWLFYSLDNINWINVATLNPSIANVPNTVGVTTTTGSFGFSTPVAVNGTFYLRFVDDNASQTSPDQIIGLNNFSIAAVPEAGTLAMLSAGLSTLGWLGARRRSRR